MSDEKCDTMMRTAREYIESMLGGPAENEGLTVDVNDRWLEISLDSEVSFDSGNAGLKPGALAFLREIARWLTRFTLRSPLKGIPTACR